MWFGAGGFVGAAGTSLGPVGVSAQRAAAAMRCGAFSSVRFDCLPSTLSTMELCARLAPLCHRV